MQRAKVNWYIVASPASARNCLGLAAVDIGHNRVPPPPERITGVIFIQKAYSMAIETAIAECRPILQQSFISKC
jgi:hypothetical protein